MVKSHKPRKEKKEILPINGTSNTSDFFLQGGGEMGKRIREFDWNNSALGPIEGWPQSLKISVSIMVNSAFPMFIWWGKDELINIYNDAYIPILGKKHPDALGRPGKDVWKEIWNDVGPLATKVFTTGKPVFLKDLPLMMKRNGFLEQTYFTFSYSPIHEESGNIMGIFCACNETTKEIIDMRRMQESEDRFRTLIQQGGDAIQLVSEKGDILYTSDSIKQVLGYTPEELNGTQVLPFLHPDDTEYFMKKLDEIIAHPRKPISLSYRVKHKDGTWAWLEVKGVNHLETPGINALVGNFRNVTERKKADEELQYRKTLLEVQMEVSPLGILVVSPEGRMVTFNQRFAELWQFPSTVLESELDEVALKAAQKQLLEPEEFMKRVTYLYQTKQQSQEKIYFLDGRIFDRYGSPLMGEDGTYYGYVWFFLDITEREQLIKQKDEFLGIASHELKTPVTSIKAYAQVLERMFRREGNVRAADNIAKLDMQINKLNTLISDLLDVTKIQSGRLLFHQDYFDFNEVVRETVEELERTAEKHTLILKLAQTRTVYGDRERIGQVIANFITNAIKYSPQADKVLITTESNTHRVTLKVQDFGIGIDEADRPRVFEQFFRVKGDKQHTFPGLGLGLYISSEIINRSQGDIWVESEKGKGSTFFFTLPLPKKKPIKQSVH